MMMIFEAFLKKCGSPFAQLNLPWKNLVPIGRKTKRTLEPRHDGDMRLASFAFSRRTPQFGVTPHGVALPAVLLPITELTPYSGALESDL